MQEGWHLHGCHHCAAGHCCAVVAALEIQLHSRGCECVLALQDQRSVLSKHPSPWRKGSSCEHLLWCTIDWMFFLCIWVLLELSSLKSRRHNRFLLTWLLEFISIYQGSKTDALWLKLARQLPFQFLNLLQTMKLKSVFSWGDWLPLERIWIFICNTSFRIQLIGVCWNVLIIDI